MTDSDKKRLYTVLGLFFLAIAALAPGFFPGKMPSWWPSDKINLGLDLKGGSYFVLDVQTAEAVKSQLNSIAVQAKRDLRKEKAGVVRVKQTGELGLAVTLVRDGGIPKVQKYFQENYPTLRRGQDSKSGRRTTMNYTMPADKAGTIESDSVDSAIETIRNRIDQTGVREPTIQKSGASRIIVQLPDVTNIDAIKSTIGSVAKLDFMLVANPGDPGGAATVTKKFRGGGEVQLEDEILMSGDVIKNANVSFSPDTNETEVTLRLNSVGARLFDSITADNVGRRLAIVLDGVVQSSPNINERISGGTASITGGFTADEARELAIVLRSGALPAPLEFLEERTVGASLGEDSIRKGVLSMLAGVGLVIIFIIIYYRKAGMLAVASLLINLTFLLALLALLQATLTLPGIAGLILTVGMAVDANVIIFERIREELRAGATPAGAVEGGFSKAHWTIMDANITTFLTGLVLYWLGTGPIKGFAVTLCLGILTSVFSALVVSYAFFRAFKVRDSQGELSI